MAASSTTIVILGALKEQVQDGLIVAGSDPSRNAKDFYNTLLGAIHSLQQSLPDDVVDTGEYRDVNEALSQLSKSVTSLLEIINAKREGSGQCPMS